MYKRTKYKVAYYPAYTNAYKYYRKHIEVPIPGVEYGDTLSLQHYKHIIDGEIKYQKR